MPSDKLLDNGSTQWVLIRRDGGVHVSVDGDFGGGTVGIEKTILGVAYPLNEDGVPITFTSGDDSSYNLQPSDKIRLTLTGATSPDISWSITGS